MAIRVQIAAATAGCLLLASTALADSNLHPNTVKYSDKGQKPATGRTGDATIEALALRGKDGVTEVTVTSNGNLDKVQVKFHDQTRNFTGSGGTFTTQLTGLHRRTPIDIQANVSGPDAARTGVVSVTEKVKHRPELAMQYVAAPPHAVAGVPVHIVADVGENWGDVGARTNCVLLKNGIEIDRAENIWIDADRTVACEFAVAFPPGSGTVELRAAVRDTMPADYDTSNDTSAPFSIKVYDRLTELESWTANAFQTKFYNRSYQRDGYGEWESISYGHRADALFQTTFRGTQPNVGTLRASVSLTTDGRILSQSHDVWFDYQAREDWGIVQSQCSVAQLGERNNYIRSCHLVTPWDGEFTYFNFSWGTGDVTYISRGWFSWYIGGPPAYVYYYNFRDVYGNGVELGDSVTFDIQISDGTNFWSANPTIPLTTTTGYWSSPWTCEGEGPWMWCGEAVSEYEAKQGRVSGGMQ